MSERPTERCRQTAGVESNVSSVRVNSNDSLTVVENRNDAASAIDDTDGDGPYADSRGGRYLGTTSHTPDVPDSLCSLKASIVTSLNDHCERWMGQPRDERQWRLYREDWRNVRAHDPVESEYWQRVKHELQYLKTVHDYYVAVNERTTGVFDRTSVQETAPVLG